MNGDVLYEEINKLPPEVRLKVMLMIEQGDASWLGIKKDEILKCFEREEQEKKERILSEEETTREEIPENVSPPENNVIKNNVITAPTAGSPSFASRIFSWGGLRYYIGIVLAIVLIKYIFFYPLEIKYVGSFRVAVDYSKFLMQMIEAGKYDWVDPDTQKINFERQMIDSRQIDIELIAFNKEIVFDEVVRELAKHNLRPVTIEEILAFGALYHQEQVKNDIVALGARYRIGYDGRVEVLCLGFVDGGRTVFWNRWTKFNERYDYSGLRSEVLFAAVPTN